MRRNVRTGFATVLFAASAALTAACASTVVPDAGNADATGFDAPSAVDVADAADLQVGSDVVCERDAYESLSCDPSGNPVMCAAGTIELQCSGGPTSMSCCVTPCSSPADCHDPCQPYCVTGGCNGVQHCFPFPHSCGCGICAAEDTPIATPTGERPIATIAVGDVVYGTRGNELVPVHVLRIARTPVFHHSIVLVTLRTGRVVEMSAGHPTIAGGTFGSLAIGDDVGGSMVERVEVVPYTGAFTYDLLTDGEGGAYVASGVLVGSTLWNSADLRAVNASQH